MKLFLFAFFAFTFVYAADICDPDSDGKPECTSNNVGQVSRNFWDPVHYWHCNGSDVPVSVRCPTATLFDEAERECISWKVWNWTNPCPDLEGPADDTEVTLIDTDN